VDILPVQLAFLPLDLLNPTKALLLALPLVEFLEVCWVAINNKFNSLSNLSNPSKTKAWVDFLEINNLSKTKGWVDFLEINKIKVNKIKVNKIKVKIKVLGLPLVPFLGQIVHVVTPPTLRQFHSPHHVTFARIQFRKIPVIVAVNLVYVSNDNWTNF
jgi:hypothetical protein